MFRINDFLLQTFFVQNLLKRDFHTLGFLGYSPLDVMNF
jgi:hypothetical protein